MVLDMYACAIKPSHLATPNASLTDMPWESPEEHEAKISSEQVFSYWRGWESLNTWMRQRWLEAVMLDAHDEIMKNPRDPRVVTALEDYFNPVLMFSAINKLSPAKRTKALAWKFNAEKVELTPAILNDLERAAKNGELQEHGEHPDYVRTNILQFIAAARDRIRAGDRVVFSNRW
jgi:hypothetical protein